MPFTVQQARDPAEPPAEGDKPKEAPEAEPPVPIQINSFSIDLVNMDVRLPMLAHEGSNKSEGEDYDLDKALKKAKKKEKKDKEKKKKDD